MACLGHTGVRAGVMTVLEDEMWLLMWFLEFQSLGPTPAVSPCSPLCQHHLPPSVWGSRAKHQRWLATSRLLDAPFLPHHHPLIIFHRWASATPASSKCLPHEKE